MSTLTDRWDQPMLRGTFAPVTDERDDDALAVTGSLPAGLRGTFIRNGPNPRFEPIGRYHMFDGDAMLHAVTIGEAGASYRNRWIRTAGLEAELRAGRALYGGMGEMRIPTRDEVGDAGKLKNLANTHIIRHAGRDLALWEGGPPTEVTPALETVGVWDFDGALEGSFTAHPKIDPRTGELLAFGYAPFAPFLRYHQIAADGTLVRSLDIDLPEAIVMHDFAVTDRHVIFVDGPLLFDVMGAVRNEPMFRWDPDHVTRIGVLPRDGDEVTWYETDPAYVNHTWNAWEEDGEIVFSGSRIDGATNASRAMEEEGADADPGMPTRYRIDPAAGTVTAEQFDDLGGDFPRINDAYAGVRSRYLYQVAFWGTPDVVGHFDTIVKYDDEAGTRTHWHAGAGQLVGEAVFAADPDGRAEDDGWLLATITDRATGSTDVAVLEAGDVAAGPIARIHLPRRLPFGFHANWFAA